MSDHARIFPDKAQVPSDEFARDTDYGLPPNLLAEARRRLRRLSLLLVTFAGLDCAVLTVATNTDGRPATTEDQLYLALCYACLALFGGLWVIARSDRFKHSLVLNLGLLGEVVTCFVLSVVNPEAVFYGGVGLPQSTWVVGFIIAFPLIVPCPPFRTLVTAIVAASMAPLGLIVLNGLWLLSSFVEKRFMEKQFQRIWDLGWKRIRKHERKQ